MKPAKLALFSLLVGIAVAVVPALVPAGPTGSLDAASYLVGGRFFVGAGVVFLGGLLTALTPCVYPLIPITVSVFGARKAESRGKALLLTSAYIVGMGLVFSALGILAATTGKAFGSMLGSPLVAVFLAVFLLLLASSMFGAFELQVPFALQQKLNGVGGAGVFGALLMGSVSGFLAAPCTGPVLTGLLTFVAQTQNLSLGAGLLFIYALGIGVPFFVIGVFAVQLPKSGVWMEWVKSVLGVLLVALAVMYVKDASPLLRTALEDLVSWIGRTPGTLVAVVLAAVGIFLGAVHRSFKEGAAQALLKGSGIALIVFALLLRFGALNSQAPGELWIRAGLIEKTEPRALAWNHTFKEEPETIARFDEALTTARREGRPVMIDFYADWCVACKELDREVYVDPAVVSEASRFLNLKVDATTEDAAMETLYERYGVVGLPTVLFVSSEGKVLEAPRVTGFLAPQKFLGELKKVR